MRFQPGTQFFHSALVFGYLREPTIQRKCISTLLRFGAAATVCIIAITLFLGGLLSSTAGLPIAFFPYITRLHYDRCAFQPVDYRLVLYQAEERPKSYAMLAVASSLSPCRNPPASGHPPPWRLRLAQRKIDRRSPDPTFGCLARGWLRGGWDRSFVREAIPIALPLVPHLLLALGLVAADRLILQRYRSMEEVGLYSLAYTFGMVMFLVTTSISQAWSPVFYLWRAKVLRRAKLSAGC